MLRRWTSGWGTAVVSSLLLSSLASCGGGGGSGGGGGGSPTAGSGVLALDAANHLFGFELAAPGTITPLVLIGPLLPGERIVGIDFRPATGLLYGLAVDANGAGTLARLLLIDSGTGYATLVGTGLTIPIADPTARYGFDFNPTTDRIRVVNAANANFRINPILGSLVTADATINPAGQSIGSVAYDRNITGGFPNTTPYVLNLTVGALQTLGSIDGTPTSANAGTLFNVGPLGIAADPASRAALDIRHVGTPPVQIALAAFDSDPTAVTAVSLYTINLATGGASLVGAVGTGTLPVEGLAVR